MNDRSALHRARRIGARSYNSTQSQRHAQRLSEEDRRPCPERQDSGNQARREIDRRQMAHFAIRLLA